MRRRIIPLLSLLAPAAVASVDEIPVSLPIDARYLALRVAHVLDMDAEGRAELVQDACNRIELSELDLIPEFERIRASMAIHVMAGAEVAGRCVGPEARGLMNFDLLPAIDPGGLVVTFQARAVEWRRSDDTPARFAAPLRLVTQNLVLPRLDRVRVDLGEPLAALDLLFREMVESTPEERAFRGRIAELDSIPGALVVTLAFAAPLPLGESAPEPPLDEAELAEWQRLEDELDGFLTSVVAHLAQFAESPRLRIELLAVLLDARHEIARILGADGGHDGDPLRALFVRSWDRLRPHLAELDYLLDDDDLLLAGFVAGGDLIRTLDALGPQYGVEITRDGLRRLARLLLAEDAPPAFTPLPLEVDPGLRTLFGFEPLSDWMFPPLAAASQSHSWPQRWLDFLLTPARARIPGERPGVALQNRVPRLAELDEYLALVAELLEHEARERLANDSRFPADYRERLDPLLRATAWKESCWRQFTGSGDNPSVLTSPVGAVGMMQINGRVWRGVYDLERLRDDVQYNVAAGIEILEHYFVDYAIRRGEHEQPGGADNLIRATYAAYNGGPSHLSRYRNEDTPRRLRAIDNEFWRHYRAIRRDGWPVISSCYPV